MSKTTNPYAAFQPFFRDPFFADFPGIRDFGEFEDPFGFAFGPYSPWSYACEAPKGKGAKAAKKQGRKPALEGAGKAEAEQTSLAAPLRPENPARSFFKMHSGLMRTDVKETPDAYELLVNLPGFRKDDVKLELHEGYLTISAQTCSESAEQGGTGAGEAGKAAADERAEGAAPEAVEAAGDPGKPGAQSEAGSYIRRERYCGSCKRSFYVGDEILEDGIRAKFQDGVLDITLPKNKALLEKKAPALIAID